MLFLLLPTTNYLSSPGQILTTMTLPPYRHDSLQLRTVIENVDDFEEAIRCNQTVAWLEAFLEYWFRRWPVQQAKGKNREVAIAEEKLRVYQAFADNTTYARATKERERLLAWGNCPNSHNLSVYKRIKHIRLDLSAFKSSTAYTSRRDVHCMLIMDMSSEGLYWSMDFVPRASERAFQRFNKALYCPHSSSLVSESEVLAALRQSRPSLELLHVAVDEVAVDSRREFSPCVVEGVEGRHGTGIWRKVHQSFKVGSTKFNVVQKEHVLAVIETFILPAIFGFPTQDGSTKERDLSTDLLALWASAFSAAVKYIALRPIV
ncbi:hypothetical protein DFP72DRAFT_848993 [Ephemerocybe angulata]|uniref:Uncharacterized protein n=1 Tax=Ephemerocybe angulata TaxID=980116 RepID=A0A8H6HWS4_9AGAR|nr:hypothetical protein DFP72DRAFT_848993 [Tulosesus angulatus]